MTIDSGVREEALLSMAYLTSPQVSVPQFLESMTTSNQRTLTPRSLLTGTVIRRYFPSMDNGPLSMVQLMELERGNFISVAVVSFPDPAGNETRKEVGL